MAYIITAVNHWMSREIITLNPIQDFKPWSTLRHVAESGQVTDILPRQFKALKYSDVVERRNNYSIEVVGEVIRLKDRPEKKVLATGVTNIIFRNPASIYALVEGGWLSLPFVHPANFLVDRNVVSILGKIAGGDIRQDLSHTHWWLSFLNNPVATFNPILYAWEGDSRRTPTFSEFCESFDKGAKEISAVLPKANITKFQYANYQAAYATIMDLSKRQEREAKFLLHVIPFIKHRCPRSKLTEYEREIFGKAKELELKNRSLVVVAAFSCLFEREDGSGYLVGRGILKPPQVNSEEGAYNVLSDLKNVELFILSHGLGEEAMSLCTCDRAIAAFWCLIGPHSFRYENGKFTYSVLFKTDLFPRLSPEELGIFLSELH